MRYLTLGEVAELHRRLLQASGGTPGIRDLGALDSAIAQPRATFGGTDLYPTVAEKAAALCFSLVQNHPFVDGNKRTGLVAMLAFLGLNGRWLEAPDADLTDLVLGVADGRVTKAEVAVFVRRHSVPRKGERA